MKTPAFKANMEAYGPKGAKQSKKAFLLRLSLFALFASMFAIFTHAPEAHSQISN